MAYRQHATAGLGPATRVLTLAGEANGLKEFVVGVAQFEVNHNGGEAAGSQSLYEQKTTAQLASGSLARFNHKHRNVAKPDHKLSLRGRA
jgi:hypothetical protein